MIFRETSLPGAFVIDVEKQDDVRGFFARTWCRREFEAHGLDTRIVQCSVSFNARRGTLRGLHYQVPPYEEVKLVRCTKGVIYDVIVDVRPGSRTFLETLGVELTADNGRMLYVPKGFAHGFQTLVDETEIFYQISEYYTPEAQRGLRWDDPALGIEWPETPERVISDRDAAWPYLGAHVAPAE
jgi:dTDP-4-dehydrorhamnose 3,5-epimerase